MNIVNFFELIASVTTIFDNIKKKNTKSKNRLTNYLFTNRTKDINNILKLISLGEKFILISDNKDISGKTWLSKKICDCINHPNDNKKYQAKKCKKRRALYFDLNNCNINLLDNIFSNEDIDRKTLCVFDHCKKSFISEIKTKQKYFHFSSIVILDRDEEIPLENFTVYNIGSFPAKEIVELQNKIQEEYSQIDDLSKNEMEILYSLTDGNVKRISFMLNSQETVSWIKKIAKNELTEYDKELGKIQVELFQGRYERAEKLIYNLYKSDKDKIYANNDYFYKYMLIKADCLHLLNKYDEAIQILETANDKNKFSTYGLEATYQLKLGHFYKHIWNSNDSLKILNEASKLDINAKLEMLGVLSSKYFIDEEICGFSDLKTKELYDAIINELSTRTVDDPQRLKRHQIINSFYSRKNEKLDFDNLISRIDNIIDCYKAENNRLIANAVFLKGELFRQMKNYTKAIACYNESLTYTKDDNIKVQVEIILYYLKYFKKVNNIQDIDIIETTNISQTHNNKYALELIRRLNSIKLEDPSSKKILECFENRIMTIL